MNLQIFQNPDYKTWLSELKERIRSAQLKAAVKVNTDLLTLYWQLGKEIHEKQSQSTWGDALIEQLSKDLLSEFPGMKGFSRTNLFYIRKWYLFYYNQLDKVPQLVGQLKGMQGNELIPQLVGQIPWGQNREIITKTADIKEALFYVQETIKNNWSRKVLLVQMENNLYQRQGKAFNNFELTLSKPQADLAIETLKNPYNFDFLSLGTMIRERDLENALIDQITKFLLELGHGFAYMGRQFRLEVNGDEYFMDLLFYHTKLRCYVVVELKITDFEPEYTGKLNFYLSVVDDQLKGPEDQPTIGILLCKTPNKVVVEYSLKNSSRPLGIAEYQFTQAIPEDLKGELPTIEELEMELEKEIELPPNSTERKIQYINILLGQLNEEEVKQPRSGDANIELFVGSLFRLNEVMMDKLSNIKNLFTKTLVYYKVGTTGYVNFDKALEVLEKGGFGNQIGLGYVLEGFKKAGIHAFDIGTNIYIDLQEYAYTVHQERDVVIYKKLYHQSLSDDEINHLAKIMVDALLDSITEKLEKLNNTN